ncbi:RNA-directed DNA polymerase, eukaryota [Tanacetum coccineum]
MGSSGISGNDGWVTVVGSTGKRLVLSNGANEELTQKISHSIFVTNFPDSVNSRDLWRECSVYGTVVDVFIPSKKSKAGKRFAFVRFIKVRFDRPHKPSAQKSNFPPLNGSTRIPGHGDKFPGFKQKNGSARSYVSAVNGVSSSVHPGSLISPSPALVLDDACITERDFSKCAMGKVKDFNSIPQYISQLTSTLYIQSSS